MFASVFKPFKFIKAKHALAVLALSCSFGHAAFSVPSLTGPLVDQARIFNPKQQQQIEFILNAVDQGSDVQMAVLTVDSLQGESIEQASIAVTDVWQLGQAKSDKGLLLLISKKDKRVRIEVGQGLEGDLPDAYAKRIIDKHIIPNFRKGNFFDGTMQAMRQSLLHVLPEDQVNAFFQGFAPKPRPTPKQKTNPIFLYIFIAIFIYGIVFGKRVPNNGRRSYGGFDNDSWGGGSGGGFSGGGGGFSGGGSSGSW